MLKDRRSESREPLGHPEDRLHLPTQLGATWTPLHTDDRAIADLFSPGCSFAWIENSLVCKASSGARNKRRSGFVPLGHSQAQLTHVGQKLARPKCDRSRPPKPTKAGPRSADGRPRSAKCVAHLGESGQIWLGIGQVFEEGGRIPAELGQTFPDSSHNWVS